MSSEETSASTDRDAKRSLLRSSSFGRKDPSARLTRSNSFTEHSQQKRKSQVPVLEGHTFFYQHKVGQGDVASTQRTGGVQTLSTAKLSQIVEDACVKAVSEFMEDGYGTAVCAVNMKHTAPMAIGSVVQLEVTVASAIRRQIVFDFVALDAEDPKKIVATGTHQRVYMQMAEMHETLKKKRIDTRGGEAITVGLSGTAVHYVDERDVGSMASTTAAGDQDGDPDLRAVSTSTLMTWSEEAAIAALEEYLPPGKTTVGAQTIVAHLAPTPKGMAVTCKATLTSVEGRKLMFEVIGHDRVQPVVQGTHLRFLVDKELFEAKAQANEVGGAEPGGTSPESSINC